MSAFEYHKQRKAYAERYPINGKALFNWCLFMFDSYGYGFYDSKAKCQKHRNIKSLYNKKTFWRRLAKTDIYDHFLAQDKSDMLWFTNACYAKDGVRLVSPMLDFDDKSGTIDIDEAVKIVREIHPAFDAMFVSKSTGGKGRHGLPLLEYPIEMSNFEISDIFNEMASILKTHVRSCLGIADPDIKPFDVIRGHPVCRLGKYEIESSGTLARAPGISNDAEAGAFLACMEKSYPLDEVMAALRSLNTKAEATQEQAGGESLTDIGGQISKVALKPVIKTLTNDSIRTLDCRQRYYYSIIQLTHLLGYPPSFDEVWGHYHAQGYNTGNDIGDRRYKGLQKALVDITASYDPSKQAKSYTRWIDAINNRRAPLDLYYAGTRLLKPEQVAFQFNLYAQKLEEASLWSPDSCRKNYIQTAAKKAKTEGTIGFTIDNKQKAAIERLLIKWGWLEMTQDYEYTQQVKSPRMYTLGKNSPAGGKQSCYDMASA